MCSHRGSSGILLVIWALLTVCLFQGTQLAIGPGRQAGISATTGIFRDATTDAGIDFVHFNGMSGERYLCEMMGPGGAMFDYDNDGDLDLYLIQGRMLGPGKTLSDAVFPVSDSKPLIDRLYRNDLQTDEGGGRRLHFTDVTEESGIRSPGYGMGVATGDFDNDGWIDLYVTNFGPNQMFRNNGDGTFTDVTRQAARMTRAGVSARRSWTTTGMAGWTFTWATTWTSASRTTSAASLSLTPPAAAPLSIATPANTNRCRKACSAIGATGPSKMSPTRQELPGNPMAHWE